MESSAAGETSMSAQLPQQGHDEEGEEIEARSAISSSLFQPPALDHTNPFLSPSTTTNFNVDDFLLSRASGSTLKQITDDLEEYSINLKNQLNIVVDRDFKGFVSLGTALKAEGPRIARLDWKVAPPTTSRASTSIEEGQNSLTRKEGDEEWNKKFETPRGSGGNLGLDKVRSEVVDVRDQLRKAEEDVRQVMRRKEETTAQKTNLMMLLSLNDSLRRIETLLLATSVDKEEEEASSDEEDGIGDQGARYWQTFSKVEEYGESDSDSPSSDEGDTSDAKHRQSTSRPPMNARRTSSRSRRRSSGLLSARRRSSYGMNEATEKSINAPTAATMDLPTRIARASSEHAALVFLRDRASAIGFSTFVTAHRSRWLRVRELLKDDLRRLIRILTRYNGASSIVGKGRKPTVSQDDLYYKMERAELQKWTVNAIESRERKSEQLAWLTSAMSTWSELPPTDPKQLANGAREAEATIRTSLVENWARECITSDALTKPAPDPRTPKTPFGFGQGEGGFASLQQAEDEEDGSYEYLLSPDLVEYSEDDFQGQALIRLYNDILIFAATQANDVSQAAERVITKSGQDSLASFSQTNKVDNAVLVQSQSHCDIFVRVLWDEVATRLMEQLGGQLFFAGRPDVFHRNYTISMAFLQAFESLAPSDRARAALHQHSTYQTFRKRWQISVYFQIRLRDSITRLEKALSSSSGSQFGAPQPASQHQQQSLPFMIATEEALACFRFPWKRGVHITELMHRQWRLSLQILSRYKGWIEEELPSDIVIANRRVLDSAKGISRSSSDQGRNHSPSRAGTPTVVDPEADDALLSSFTIIAADLIWLEKGAMEVYNQEIVAMLGKKRGNEKLVLSLRETLEASLSMKNTILPLLSSRITSILKSRCAEPLRLVRSVSTQYRTGSSASGSGGSGGGGGAVAEPSSFVIQFLRPVRLYLGKGDGKMEPRRIDNTLSSSLDRRIRSQWITEVVEDFIARYAASLRTMNKNYESLRRLKRGNTAGSASMGFGSFFNRGGGSGAATPTTGPGKVEEDVEAKRMHSQMMIDVECLEREVQDLVKVDTDVQTDTPGWTRLKEAARGEQDE